MDWRKHAHLFANGEFKVKCHNPEFLTPPYIGEFEPEMINGVKHRPEFYRLIARRIYSMTFMELRNVPIHQSWDATTKTMWESLLHRIEKDSLRFIDARYLLSIGVYPFEWNESVIDINQIDEG